MSLLVLQKILLEALLDLLSLPFWWYSVGVKHSALWCAGILRSGNEFLGPGLWLKNIFVPMYGQYDFQGRIISFIIRFFQVIVRGFALIVWLIVCLGLFAVWLALPVALVYCFINVGST
jgi:hypothetical protein